MMRYALLAIAPPEFPKMTWMAMATARLYCPATLFEILLKLGSRCLTRSVLEAHQAVIAGYAAYPPDTTRNVPKYFTPIGAAEMLIANPARQSSWPHSTNGERRWMRSDHTPHATTVIAAEMGSGAQDPDDRVADAQKYCQLATRR